MYAAAADINTCCFRYFVSSPSATLLALSLSSILLLIQNKVNGISGRIHYSLEAFYNMQVP